jgi:hypothetical protein
MRLFRLALANRLRRPRCWSLILMIVRQAISKGAPPRVVGRNVDPYWGFNRVGYDRETGGAGSDRGQLPTGAHLDYCPKQRSSGDDLHDMSHGRFRSGPGAEARPPRPGSQPIPGRLRAVVRRRPQGGGYGAAEARCRSLAWMPPAGMRSLAKAGTGSLSRGKRQTANLAHLQKPITDAWF